MSLHHKNTLEIQNLVATVNNVKILNGVNLTIKAGEIHAIMGTNGSKIDSPSQ